MRYTVSGRKPTEGIGGSAVPSPQFPMLAELTREEIDAGLDAVVDEVLTAAGVEGPPVDAIAVAGRLGLSVVRDDTQHGRARYARLRGIGGRPPRPTILLRDDPRSERRQWAVAHEIGEHHAARIFEHWGVDPREAPALREQAANRFAARLLLPEAWFFPTATECDWDLLALKERFSTASHELIARRMLDRPEPPVIVTILDHDRVTFRRGNTGGRTPPLSPVERTCQRSAHRTGEPCRGDDPTHITTAWPIHEPGWPREILRTEPADEIAI